MGRIERAGHRQPRSASHTRCFESLRGMKASIRKMAMAASATWNSGPKKGRLSEMAGKKTFSKTEVSSAARGLIMTVIINGGSLQHVGGRPDHVGHRLQRGV